MAKVEIELDHAGIRELLESDAMASLVREKAEQIAARAGDGFELTEPRIVDGSATDQFKGRQAAGVQSVTYEAAEEEANNKTLTRAVMG